MKIKREKITLQLFNIMIEFPDSQPALEDLKECLAKTDLRYRHFFKAIFHDNLFTIDLNNIFFSQGKTTYFSLLYFICLKEID